MAKLSSIFIEDEEEKDIGDSSHLISNTEPTPKDIREDCITVTVDAQTNNIISIAFDLYQNFDWENTKSGMESCLNKTQKFGLIFEALGKLLFGLFMEGEPLPLRPINTSEDTLQSNNASSNNDDSVPTEDDILDMFRSLDSSGSKNAHITTAMQTKHLPIPICQLVTDLFNTSTAIAQQRQEAMDADDSCFNSLSEVHADLQQMIDSPEAYLYGVITSRWELVFGNNLFGRENKLMQLREAANRVHPPSLDTNDDQTSKKEVVIVNGHSGSGKSRLINEIRKPLLSQGWFFLRCKFSKMGESDPTSVVALGLDEFFSASMICKVAEEESKESECSCSNHHCPRKVCSILEQSIGRDGIEFLSQQMPGLRKLIGNTDFLNDVNGKPINSSFQIHQLFGTLLDTLMSISPVLFFVDDVSSILLSFYALQVYNILMMQPFRRNFSFNGQMRSLLTL